MPSSFLIEAAFSECNTGNIHSARDTIDANGFSFDHMSSFVRIAVAYVRQVCG